MMSKTLFALTLVTAITTPIMICTGIYGMNFADMPELVQPSPTPFGPRNLVLVVYAASGSWVVSA